MKDIIKHTDTLISIQTDQVRQFIFDNLESLSNGYQFVYVYISHREYNIDKIETDGLHLVKTDGEDSFFFYIPSKMDYIDKVNVLYDFFVEYQFWTIYLSNKMLYDVIPMQDFSGTSIGKGVEGNVLWLSNPSVSIE